MEQITEEAAELVARAAALDAGKASPTACVRLPHDTVPGRRRQKVRMFATATPLLLELRQWLVCHGCPGARGSRGVAQHLPRPRRRNPDLARFVAGLSGPRTTAR